MNSELQNKLFLFYLSNTSIAEGFAYAYQEFCELNTPSNLLNDGSWNPLLFEKWQDTLHKLREMIDSWCYHEFRSRFNDYISTIVEIQIAETHYPKANDRKAAFIVTVAGLNDLKTAKSEDVCDESLDKVIAYIEALGYFDTSYKILATLIIDTEGHVLMDEYLNPILPAKSHFQSKRKIFSRQDRENYALLKQIWEYQSYLIDLENFRKEQEMDSCMAVIAGVF